jgi:hypothetical protein
MSGQPISPQRKRQRAGVNRRVGRGSLSGALQALPQRSEFLSPQILAFLESES